MLKGRARITPLLASATLSRMTGRSVHLKAENLQRTGSFKVRGAYVKLASLSAEERAQGVIAASAGNHGQAVAWAAGQLGVASTVLMPLDASISKIEATRGYGAEVLLFGERFDDALAEAKRRAAEDGRILIHAFDDERVIEGQGTLGLELAEQLGEEEGTVIVPIGGGGLAAGVAVALRELRPRLRLVGVQAANCSPFAGGGEPHPTIADGIAVKQPGALTRRLIDERLDEIVTVSDEEIAESILLLLERSKLLVEGAGAASLAALLFGKQGTGPVTCILSGGNIDPAALIPVLRHGLTRTGRVLVLRTTIEDRPGQLAALLAEVAAARANVISVEHGREGVRNLHLTETTLELRMLTRDAEHCDQVVAHLRERGYPVERVD